MRVRDSRKEAVVCLTAFCSFDHAARLGQQDDEMAAGNAVVLAHVQGRGRQARFLAC